MASVASSSNLPDAIVQEIRALLAVHGKEVVMTDLASGEKKEGQDNLLGKVFHGSSGVGGYVSLLQLFLDGKPPYASAFNKLPIENNREGNELTIIMRSHMVAREPSLCLRSLEYLVLPNGRVIVTRNSSCAHDSTLQYST